MKLILKSKRLTLRPPKFSDALILEKYINDRLVVRWLANLPYPYPKNGMKKWIRKCQKRIKNKKGFNFTIIFDNEPIGSCSLGKIDWENKKARLGYWLARKYWGTGIMSEAVKLVLGFGFRKLKLHRVEAGTYDKNKRSQKILEKSGFKREGISRQAFYKNGRWHNNIRYGLLITDYKKLSKKQRK